MQPIFDFGNASGHEKTIYKTWNEFRNALACGKFLFDDTDAALKETFLSVFDDMFEKNNNKEYFTKTIKELRNSGVVTGRGTILDASEILTYERFIPKSEFIKKDNRFSPPGVEWLYLALSDNYLKVKNCAIAECKATKGKRFGTCHFEMDDRYDNCKIVDLTISDSHSYSSINAAFENFGQKYTDYVVKESLRQGKVLKGNEDYIKKQIENWAVHYYARLISKRLFEPVDSPDSKYMYSPFQCLAVYFKKCGFDGIIYASTVYDRAKDMVLFDKNIAYPTGKMSDFIV